MVDLEPILPEGAHLVLDPDGNVVGVEIGGVTVDGEDFNQETINALVESINNPPPVKEVLERITR